ncbi:MAG: 2-oxoacid:ferredoxin oxidoreductase subunit beta [Chlorobi bacterium]|nr:2-oxoacid:ferredoxin oxidoreductase subunit beta [Chlorobiota bacterium]
MSETKEFVQYTPRDFKSDQEVRWCPGCGDHAILNSMQRAMSELGIRKEMYAVISGIGCSSRFPYYMNTYGFHTIHGRAAAIASGTKVSNPELSVWEITGDGDALAIGGNHLIHAVRRNVNINIILFNNQIYGLTKGQYSPTSKKGQITKTSPYGTVEDPFHPGELVIGAQGKFFARTMDNNIKLSTEIFKEAARHEGTSVIEVLQNCVIYNDGAYADINDREHREDRQLILHDGEPMIFGKNRDKGIIMDGFKLQVVTLGEKGITEDDILIHHANENNPGLHTMISNMRHPSYPVALGVIRNVQSPAYDMMVHAQIDKVKAGSKIKSVNDLLFSGNTWEVE